MMTNRVVSKKGPCALPASILHVVVARARPALLGRHACPPQFATGRRRPRLPRRAVTLSVSRWVPVVLDEALIGSRHRA